MQQYWSPEHNREKCNGFNDFSSQLQAVEDNHMNRNNLTQSLTMVLLAAFLTITGCGGGSDGATGAKGDPGDPGIPGPVGPPGSDATPPAVLALLPRPEVTIDSVTVDTSGAAPVIVTTFTPTANSAYEGGITAVNPTNSTRLNYLRFAYARLMPPVGGPAGTPSVYYKSPQWVRYSSGDRDPTHLTDNGDGSFTMRTPIAAADYAANMPTRALLMVSAVADRTAPLNVITNFVPDGSTPPASALRDVVTEDSCESCHANQELGSQGISNVHGGSRYLAAACVVCHTDKANSASGTEGVQPSRVFPVMLHQIHDAINAKAVNFGGTIATPSLGADDWSEITYPQNVELCSKCHTDVANAANYTNAPSVQVCTSCHTGTTFQDDTSTGSTVVATHTGGPQPLDNTTCATCHNYDGPLPAPTGRAPTAAAAHDTTPTGINVPEFEVTLSLTPPAVGSFYTVGEAPVVTVTLKDQNGVDVNPAFYTTAKGAAGNTADTALNVANLYVYGPRNQAVPVLTTASSTDTVNTKTPPQQGPGLFVGSTVLATSNGDIVDPGVTSDATGFHYQLQAIPAGIEAGTYMVRVRIGDYGRVGTGDYVNESIAFTNIQIGTDTVEPKVSGSACVNCHGTGTAPFHDERHAVVFDTDQCLACHDRSGNYADYIGNRVHAVHSASAIGDLHVRDWSEVTFPQQVNNCTICHTNPTPETPVWRQPDPVVCGGCHGSLPTADPSLYTVDITQALGAANHMLNNGGDFDITTPRSYECLVCHGSGKVADTFITHRLIAFPVSSVIGDD